jgi:hypothetical protein
VSHKYGAVLSPDIYDNLAREARIDQVEYYRKGSHGWSWALNAYDWQLRILLEVTYLGSYAIV